MWSTCVEGVIGIFSGGDIVTGFFGGVLVKFQWVFDTFFFFRVLSSVCESSRFNSFGPMTWAHLRVGFFSFFFKLVCFLKIYMFIYLRALKFEGI